MKTKIAMLILPLCALAAAVSCNKQGDATINGDGNLIFNISVGASTKTGTIDDTASEAAISSLRIFMIDANSDGTVASTWNCAELTDFTYSSTTGKATSNLRYTMAGHYLFFVIANWPESLTLDTSSYEALTGCYDAASCYEDLWDEDNFLMTQNGGPVYKYISNLACDETSPIVVDIELDRVAAKVSVNTDPNASYPLIGTLMGGHDAVYVLSKVAVKGVALVNCVNQFNVIAHTGTSGELVTPSSDPEYSLSTGYYNTTVTNPDWVDLGTSFYCLENNSPLYSDVAGDSAHPDAAVDTKMKARTTGVVFKVEVKSLSEFQSEADTDIENENLRIDPEDGLWKTKAAGDEGSNDEQARTLYRYKGVIFADWQQLFAQNPDLESPFGTDETPSAASLREKGVYVYEDGIIYYTYWLKDDGVLSVKRNTYYNLLLNQIASFGDDVPGGRNYNGADPISLDSGLVTVSLSIADWDIKAEQNYTL